ncbi:Peptidyl-tRNA hydrolase ICT1 [Schistosoma japonicum]|nr:Peptidyl-tRNA hydrolase ICT1 [Schistosoma japonicum]
MIRAGKLIYSYISRPSIRCVSSFESAQNPTNLYPNSDPNAVFKKPIEPSVEANRINRENYFIITSDHTRKQILNQADCLERIRRIVRECENSLFKPEPNPETLEAIQRRKVKANEERLREKKEKSFTKQLRQDNHSVDLF